ncbi:glucans biosynthesis glucosyltransferase MdoH [Alsobacter sp. SYSU M60028]|uniref:Glucans biosynthesis glucosyltransferase H n=2 Tax=Alsobacter ponti TaxID=2962936 RepID=A0ABT1LEQ3_9HYPH|nr:glucans biosynthesis glucosyltransferase MdoH [Alsobacter ponti]
MPVQSLSTFPRSAVRKPIRPRSTPWLTRLFVFGGAIALTGWGAFEMYKVVSVSVVTPLQWALVALFTVNFSWIALAFTSAIVGFLSLLRRPRPRGLPSSLSTRTAVVMPVYNEATARVFASLQSMIEDIATTGLLQHFDFFILSDSTQPNAWIAEERAFYALRERMGPSARIFYRHRKRNTGRKAGNIEDFVTRWGGAYDHMLVLDADSLMTSACIVGLTAAMEADPDSGIIQSLPLIINRNTLFARLQQFAAKIYGPVIATGLAVWSGREGNYWGHNAIIRTRAFADHCGMPTLSGKPPFGGHIMSHDFVEAALIRRAGWSVYMLPDLQGSYEESPPSLIDLATRDRRWCQGNLQHVRVVGAAGLTWPTRQHFTTGIMSYLASPLWLAQLLVGVMLVLQTRYVRPEYFTREFSLFPTWPRFDAERALMLFGVTMAILIAPKIFGLILALIRGDERRLSGGGFRLTVSALFEILMSALMAPILMLIQSGAVVQIIFGRDTGWNPQRRDDGSIPFRDIVRRHRWHVLFGLFVGVSAFMIAPSLAGWMSPTILGLLLAIPISYASGQLSLGLALKRAGLLLTREETQPPAIAGRANALMRELEESGFDDANGVEAIHADPLLRARHEAMLPAAEGRRRGEIDRDRVLAQAKIGDAETIEDLMAWLDNRETMVVLHDRALLGLLAGLPRRETAIAAE